MTEADLSRAIDLPSGDLLLSTIDIGAFDGTLRANEGIILRVAA